MGANCAGGVGQNIVGTMSNMMNGVNGQNIPGSVIPPIPSVVYHVASNGQATGPFILSTLVQMLTIETFIKDRIVWKQGMSEWKKAYEVDELKDLFGSTIPPIPSTKH